MFFSKTIQKEEPSESLLTAYISGIIYILEFPVNFGIIFVQRIVRNYPPRNLFGCSASKGVGWPFC